MLALVSQPVAPYTQLSDVDEPRALPHQALVEVRAISLNRGECRRLETLQPATVTGWDLAGVVIEAAADGSGPPAGARVVGLKDGGAWVQRAAVDTEMLAQLPDEITFEQAATLPVAGLTALLSLEIGGFVLGRRVLVTGASGGVGHFAIQLAKLAGARVTAYSTSPARAAALRELGAEEVIHDLAPGGEEFDAVVEGVGGATLGLAIQRVAAGGTVVSFASTDPSDPVTYPTRSLFGRAPGARVYGLLLFSELAHTRSGARDLGRLAQLVAAGRLDCSVQREASWREAADAIAALLDRRVAGKLVLHTE